MSVSFDDEKTLNCAKCVENTSISKRLSEPVGDDSKIFSTLRYEYNIKKNFGRNYDEI